MSACVDCGNAISRRAIRCRSCNAAHIARSDAAVAAGRACMNDPSTRAKLNAALARPEVRKRRADSIRAAKLSHIHADYRDLYMSLQRYGTVRERLSAIHDQMRKDGVAA